MTFAKRFINSRSCATRANFRKQCRLPKRSRSTARKNDGPDHPETADSLNDLASLYAEMGDYAKALPLYQRALKIREKALGPDHPHTAIILNNVAESYRENGDFAKAEPLYKRAIKIWENKLGAEAPEHRVRPEQSGTALRRKRRFG